MLWFVLSTSLLRFTPSAVPSDPAMAKITSPT